MKHIKSITLTILLTAMLFTALPLQASAENTAGANEKSTKNSYNDVSGTWFEAWVKTYGYQDIFSDTSGLFNPEKTVTRMEFARLLHRALGISVQYFAAPNIADFYNDVKNSDAGAGELYDLVTCGIIDTKTSFRPLATLDRDEMVHFIMNALNYKTGGNYAMIKIFPAPYTDDADIKAAFAQDVQYATILKFINGRNSNYLCPRDGATRAEAVTVVGRLCDYLKTIASTVSVNAAASEENGGLRLTLTIKNNSTKTVTINHSSQQLFDFVILDKNGNSLYTWSATRMFAQVVTTTKIEAGKELILSDTLDSATCSAFKDKMSSIVGYITGTSADFTIDKNGYLASLPVNN